MASKSEGGENEIVLYLIYAIALLVWETSPIVEFPMETFLTFDVGFFLLSIEAKTLSNSTLKKL